MLVATRRKKMEYATITTDNKMDANFIISSLSDLIALSQRK